MAGRVREMLRKPVRAVRRRLRKARKSKSLEFSQEAWDRQYKAGKWDYLESEFARYAVLAGFSRVLMGRNPSILEIGCGTGVLHDYLRDTGYRRYKGVDISAAAIEEARARHEAEDGEDPSFSFEAADGRAYSDGHTYDLIIFNEVLFYFDDCLPVLRHYSGLLNDGGALLISMVVGPPGDGHWKVMAADYPAIDSWHLTNEENGLAWICRAVRPSNDSVVRG